MRFVSFALLFLCVSGRAQEPAAIDWARRQAIPLDTVQARNHFDDMQLLKKVVGEAHIVSLGEATHGTREFFQMKHRMLEFLATEMDFSIFSIEANMPEAYRLNDYVLNGVGDSKSLLKGLNFWTWNTEEVLDMIEWMREFNASGRGRLQFTGFDMQTPDVAIQNVQKFLSGAEPDYAREVSSVHSEVQKYPTKNTVGSASGTFPVNVASGRHVRFSGYIKTEGIRRGYAGLWWRVDGPGGTLFLDNMNARGPKGTTDWKQYDISVDVPPAATGIYFGMLHSGDGTAWFDSLTVEVDGVSYDDSRFDFGFESAAPKGFYLDGSDYSLNLDPATLQSGLQSLRSMYLGASGDQLFDLCSAVVDHMTAARDSYLAAGYSEWDADWAIQNARIVAQAMNQMRGSANRDLDMARNIRWILDHNPGAKLVLWAHNLHVATGGVPDRQPMGSFLRDTYGTGMVVFGFSFNRGGFQALDVINGGLKAFEAPPAPDGSFDAALAATGLPLFALDLRSVPAEGSASWFRRPLLTRNIGAGYAEGYDSSYYLNLALPVAFDAVFFVDSTTRARPVQP